MGGVHPTLDGVRDGTHRIVDHLHELPLRRGGGAGIPGPEVHVSRCAVSFSIWVAVRVVGSGTISPPVLGGVDGLGVVVCGVYSIGIIKDMVVMGAVTLGR